MAFESFYILSGESVQARRYVTVIKNGSDDARLIAHSSLQVLALCYFLLTSKLLYGQLFSQATNVEALKQLFKIPRSRMGIYSTSKLYFQNFPLFLKWRVYKQQGHVSKN